MLIVTIAIGVLLTALFLALALPVILAGLILGVVLYAIGHLLLLPFRLIGAGIGLGVGVIFVVAKLALLALVGFFLVLALVVGLAPLLPILLIALGLWMLLRPSQRRPAVP